MQSSNICPENVILAYDNMCNLDRLKIARQPLPFPAPLNKIWSSIHKIIDSFHLPNHRNPSCHTVYNPKQMKEENPDFNTQAGEQTFIWAGRYKHILCAMSKQHHLFYLHRMVLRRNEYLEKCYSKGRKPIMPKKSK